MIARAWGAGVLAFGALLLALACLVWALLSVVLLPFAPAAWGRRVGRLGAMHGFRSWLAIMEALGAWRLDLTELDRLRGAGPLVLAPNHPSLLDAVFIVSRLPDALCVMKGSLLRNFLLAPAARLARYVPNDSLLRLISRAAAELEQGGQLLLFPEGTRTVGTLGPFTEAVGAVSRRAGVPVQALVIEDEARFLGKGWPLTRIPDGVTRLTAFAVAPRMDAAALLAQLRDRLDPVFLPRPLVLVDRLPRQISGKLPREALRALAREHGIGAADRR